MKKLLKLSALLVLVSGFASCTATYYGPGYHYNCYPEYDYWGYYIGDVCYYEYYSQDGSLVKELDMVAEVADREALELEKTAQYYAEKFNLSADQGTKIARNVLDFSALSDRSEADIADFAQRLYGVNPSQIVSAVSSAQVGNNASLNSLVDEAAKNFETSSDNMRTIIKELHGKALSDNGISL